MQGLTKVKTRVSKRLGRGYGSGKGGHTSSRGMKGQKARTDVHILFEGLKVRKSLLNRLPFQRGKSKFKPNPKPIAVNLSDLEYFESDTIITQDLLVKEGFLTKGAAKRFGVKVLGDGELTKKLTVNLPASQGAREKIEKLGGQVQ